MEIEFYYDTFMYACEDERTLRITLVDDNVLMHHLHFTHAKDMAEYQKLLHTCAMEMAQNGSASQNEWLKQLLLENPFDFEYELSEVMGDE